MRTRRTFHGSHLFGTLLLLCIAGLAPSGCASPSDDSEIPSAGDSEAWRRRRCVPTTCDVQGAQCGTISNGCGGTLECGTCAAPDTCGGGGTANVCGAPTTNPTPASSPGGSTTTIGPADYHVRTDGSDTACNGSADAPASSAPACAFRTIQKAANTATAGKTVAVHSGTYAETVTFGASGTASAPIVFVGDAVVRGNVHVNGDYVVVDGLTVSPPSAGGWSAVEVAGNHDTLRNCLVTNYGASAGDQATAITLDSDSAYNVVDHCTIKDLDDIDVFHVFGHDQVVRNNFVTNVNTVNYDLNHTDFIQTWGWPGSFAYNVVVEGNLVTSSTAQLGNLSNDSNANLHDWTFRNNVFVNVEACLFAGVPRTYFYNNLFSNVGNAQGYAVSLYSGAGYSSTGDQFVNNAFINNGEDINFHSAPLSDVAVFTNNYFAGANGASKSNGESMGASFVNGGSAKFVNEAGGDFHLQAGSVLMDRARDLSTSFTVDKDGKARTGAWEIGPFTF